MRFAFMSLTSVVVSSRLECPSIENGLIQLKGNAADALYIVGDAINVRTTSVNDMKKRLTDARYQSNASVDR